VLITGESGTGKELVARAIHYNGPRAAGPFIACNCGAIPENLVESELFGHERGAFTGAASRRIGSFESAHRGTLFLDEVSELPPSAQVSLLRAVQERQIRRLGGTHAIDVDVRIVAACNRELWELVEQGLFREDLFYRLNVLTVEVPPLRERGGDLVLLARHFLEHYAGENDKAVRGFAPGCLEVLERYHWPGNIRELQHSIQRAVILARSEHVQLADLPASVRGEREQQSRGKSDRKSYNLAENERALIAEVLEATRWNISQAAQKLGTTRSTLYSKIQRYGLKPPDNLSLPADVRRAL
jgi:DNA-binding NtrC family response regulator